MLSRAKNDYLGSMVRLLLMTSRDDGSTVVTPVCLKTNILKTVNDRGSVRKYNRRIEWSRVGWRRVTLNGQGRPDIFVINLRNKRLHPPCKHNDILKNEITYHKWVACVFHHHHHHHHPDLVSTYNKLEQQTLNSSVTVKKTVWIKMILKAS